jgi:hypothetical protein
MDSKFTIRDFLVYFLTGLFLLLSLLYQFKGRLFEFFEINISLIKDTSAIYIFFLLPGLYLLGHFVQSVDHLLNVIIHKLYQQKVASKLFIPFLSHRIHFQVTKRKLSVDTFWKNCSKLIVNNAYEHPHYWNLMHQLFEGLTLITTGWCIYFLYHFLFMKFLLAFFLTIVFWIRAKRMAELFIKTVEDNISALPAIPLK